MNNNKGVQSLASGRILFLDSLRALAIIMVVASHTLGYCAELPLDQGNLIRFIVLTVAVPIFFCVDGYLFSRTISGAKGFHYSTILRNSVLRLLVPWVVFTCFYTFSRFVFERAGFFKENYILGIPWQKIVISAYGSVYAEQMYFLFSLFLIRLCSPLFKRFAIMKSFSLSLVIFFCYFTVYKSLIPFISPFFKIPGGHEPMLLALWGIQFYLVGIVLFKASQIVNLKKMFLPFLFLFVFSFFIPESISLRFNLIQHLYLLTIFLFFAFFHDGFPFLNKIGKNTMGIYLIHLPIVLKCVSLILNKFIFDPMLSFLSILFVTFYLTYCIVMLINFIPYGSILFGTPYRYKRMNGA